MANPYGSSAAKALCGILPLEGARLPSSGQLRQTLRRAICAAGAARRLTVQIDVGGSTSIPSWRAYLLQISARPAFRLPRYSAARPSRVRLRPLTVGQSGEFFRLLGESHARNTCPVSVHPYPG